MAEGGVIDEQSLQSLFKEGWGHQKKVENDDFASSEEKNVHNMNLYVFWV